MLYVSLCVRRNYLIVQSGTKVQWDNMGKKSNYSRYIITIELYLIL